MDRDSLYHATTVSPYHYFPVATFSAPGYVLLGGLITILAMKLVAAGYSRTAPRL